MNMSLNTSILTLEYRNYLLKLLRNVTQHHHNVDHMQLLSFPVMLCVSIAIQLIGILGNVIVLYILIKKMKLKTNSNWLIFNLALSDLIVSAFYIPLNIPLLAYERWIYGKLFCSVYYPLGTAAVLSSAFTLLILTCQRFRAVVYPYKKQPTTSMTKLFIIGSWFLSFTFSLPVMLILKYNKEYQVCYEDWDSLERRLYTVCVFIAGFALPSLIILVLHGCIIVKTVIKSSGKKVLSWKSNLRRLEDRRLCKVSVIITVAFAVCVLPNHLVWFLYEFGDLSQYKYHADLRVCSHVMLFVSSALNPIIYTTFSSRFRAHFNLKWLTGLITSQLGLQEIVKENMPVPADRERTCTMTTM